MLILRSMFQKCSHMSIRIFWVFGVVMALALLSCEEEFSPEPPFSQAQDTLYLDSDSWVYTANESISIQNATAYPFSYYLLGHSFDGYLLSSGKRVYLLREDAPITQRQILVDFSAIPGDTLSQISKSRYQLLLDRKFDPLTNGEVFYVLRRSLQGLKSWKERSVWIISPQKGVVAAASYNIDFRNGGIVPEMIGNPAYFRNPEFTDQIKRYDYNKASIADLGRQIIYEFDKRSGVLKSRSFEEDQELSSYSFDSSMTREWIDFRLEKIGSGIKLLAGNDCYFFSQDLELERIDVCQ